MSVNAEALKTFDLEGLFAALTVIDLSPIGKEEQFAEGRKAIVDELVCRGSETIEYVVSILVEELRD